jgi:hypothetical protein
MSKLSFKLFCIEKYADKKNIPGNEVGLMPYDFALRKLAFMKVNNQYAFCSEKALFHIIFSEYQEIR